MSGSTRVTGSPKVRVLEPLRHYQFPISNTRWVVLQIPAQVSADEWDLMMSVLDFFKPALVESDTCKESTEDAAA